MVSVILPTYNRIELLKESVDSVLKQTYHNLELIVIDDGSSDETKSYIENHLDKRIRLISQENMGRSSARNVGLLKSKGRLITFIDSDDLYLPNKIELEVKFLLDNPEYDVIYSAADCFQGSNHQNLIHRYKAEAFGSIYQQIAAYVPLTICLPTVMFRRKVFETIGFFDITLDRFEDTDYWRRISKGFQFAALGEVTCLIRTHEGNSIDGINLSDLRRQVLKYGSKIVREDLKEQGPVVFQLIANLYKHYSQAISSRSKSKLDSTLLDFMSILFEKIFKNRFEIEVNWNSRKATLKEGRDSTFRFYLFLTQAFLEYFLRVTISRWRYLKMKVRRILRRING